MSNKENDSPVRALSEMTLNASVGSGVMPVPTSTKQGRTQTASRLSFSGGASRTPVPDAVASLTGNVFPGNSDGSPAAARTPRGAMAALQQQRVERMNSIAEDVMTPILEFMASTPADEFKTRCETRRVQKKLAALSSVLDEAVKKHDDLVKVRMVANKKALTAIDEKLKKLTEELTKLVTGDVSDNAMYKELEAAKEKHTKLAEMLKMKYAANHIVYNGPTFKKNLATIRAAFDGMSVFDTARVDDFESAFHNVTHDTMASLHLAINIEDVDAKEEVTSLGHTGHRDMTNVIEKLARLAGLPNDENTANIFSKFLSCDAFADPEDAEKVQVQYAIHIGLAAAYNVFPKADQAKIEKIFENAGAFDKDINGKSLLTKKMVAKKLGQLNFTPTTLYEIPGYAENLRQACKAGDVTPIVTCKVHQHLRAGQYHIATAGKKLDAIVYLYNSTRAQEMHNVRMVKVLNDPTPLKTIMNTLFSFKLFEEKK